MREEKAKGEKERVIGEKERKGERGKGDRDTVREGCVCETDKVEGDCRRI